MELLVITILLLLNGVFAMYEIALVSARKSLLEEQARSGRIGAKAALRLLEEPEKVLSAIQVGITLIGIATGAYGGLTLSGDLAAFFLNIDLLVPYAHTLAVLIVVGVITYFSLIIGELVPKTIALNNAESIAMFLSPAMKVFGAITYPIVWVLSISTKFVIKLFGIKTREEAPLSEEELLILLRKGSEHGIIEKEESDIINEVIRFGDKHASALMTPRVDVEWIDLKDDPGKIIERALKSPHTRLLVCENHIDNIRGAVSIKDILSDYINNQSLHMDEVVFEPLYIPEQTPALTVLETFRRTKNHIGVVINEYGSIEGIITLHDLAENIMGDLPAMGDLANPEIVPRDDGTLLADGSVKIEDIEDKLQIPSLFEDDEGKPDVNTLGGLAMYKLKRVPETGDIFYAGGYSFEIVDMDGNRVDKLLIKEG
ncbi:MAG: HlyC/CorC family transporter [Deltaproteobacteria bacterium]|nr:HlyC/CorC family transporter [Deltaproteobacteria bacterium]